jgi:Short C-terminal domain
MTWIMLLVVIASSMWVGVDAGKRDWPKGKPWQWVVGSLLLWIVVFPVYLWRRNRVPLKALSKDQKTALEPAAEHVREHVRVLPKVAAPAADQRATPTPSPTAVPIPTGGNTISDLERLATLHANGALDDAEFRAAKQRLLMVSTASAVSPAGVASAAPGAGRGMGAPLAAGAAGVAGGLLLGNVGGASAAPTAGEPVSETINYHETFTGPDGEATTVDGTMESTVTFDDSGDAHVEVHDSGTVDVAGDTSHYDSDVSGDVDLGGTTEEGGWFLDGLFDLF